MGEAFEKAEEFGRKYYILIIGILIFILYKIISNN